MGQEKTFSSALSNLAKMKTDAEKANEKVQAATDKAVAFAQSLKQGTNQAASAPAAPAKPAVPAAPARPAAPASFAKPAASLKPLDEIAKLVIRGNYGNGEERKKRLIAEGYDYAQVQKRVNELLK